MDELKIKIAIDEESYLEAEQKVKRIANLARNNHLLCVCFLIGFIVGFAACAIATILT